MKPFNQQACDFFEQQKAIHAGHFNLRQDIRQCGHQFPLCVSFCNTDPSYFMGIQSSISCQRICSEFCFFDSCESLTEDQLTSYFSLAEAIREELTDAAGPNHHYTMISLVLLTRQLSPDCRKILRRVSSVKRYQPPLSGWSEIRVCVVEADSGKSTCNGDGSALQERITKGIPAKQKNTNFFTRWFSRQDT